ncbi:MAG TPA: YggT family protein, partial [Chloroflexota bacterium]|nr:YggT family protein [Chloroflexota bacterium]
MALAVAAQFVEWLVYILMTAIFLRAILSFFSGPGTDNPIMRFLIEVTEPILGPLRRVIPSVKRWDLASGVAAWLLVLAKFLLLWLLLGGIGRWA